MWVYVDELCVWVTAVLAPVRERVCVRLSLCLACVRHGRLCKGGEDVGEPVGIFPRMAYRLLILALDILVQYILETCGGT